MSATILRKGQRHKLWSLFRCEHCGWTYHSPIPAYSPMVHRCKANAYQPVQVKGIKPA